MSFEDNNITAVVRRILSSYWIDLTRLSIRTTHGTIYINGHMRRMTFEHSEMEEGVLRQLDADLRLVEKVRNVVYDLDNWAIDEMTVWRRVDPDTHKRHKPPLWQASE